jgi:hypothetical protein
MPKGRDDREIDRADRGTENQEKTKRDTRGETATRVEVPYVRACQI